MKIAVLASITSVFACAVFACSSPDTNVGKDTKEATKTASKDGGAGATSSSKPKEEGTTKPSGSASSDAGAAKPASPLAACLACVPPGSKMAAAIKCVEACKDDACRAKCGADHCGEDGAACQADAEKCKVECDPAPSAEECDSCIAGNAKAAEAIKCFNEPEPKESCSAACDADKACADLLGTCSEKCGIFVEEAPQKKEPQKDPEQ